MDYDATHAGDAHYTFPERDGDLVDLPELDQAERDGYAASIRVDLDQAISQRWLKDATLDYYNDMYEMNVAARFAPYSNAPNVCVPLVQIIMRGVYSKVAASVFVPRLYVATPLDDKADEYCYGTENFYNTEWFRKKMLFEHLETFGFSLRDGVSVLEILWEEQVSTQQIATVDAFGQKQTSEIDVTEKRGVYYYPVEYRDLVLSPATSKNPDTAETVYRRLYLSEQDLWDRVESGEMYEDEVKRVVSHHSSGQTDMTGDNSTATYKQGGTIEVGDTGSTSPAPSASEMPKARGVFEVWRGHSKAFAPYKDGKYIEVVFYYYEQLPSLLGMSRYKYWHQRRPFAVCCPIPRWGRFEGFAIPELERSMQEEINARHNQRGEAMDLKTFPGLYQTDDAKLLTPSDPIGPNARWNVKQKTDVGIIDYGNHDPISMEEEAILMSYGLRVIGLESPSLPLYGGKQPSVQQQKANQVSTSVTLDMISMQIRQFAEDVIWQTHKLNIQYMEDDQQNELGTQGIESAFAGEVYSLPYKALVQKIMLTVAGTQGALDREGRTQSIRTLYALLMQNELCQSNKEHVWNATALLLEDANLPNYTKYIGTIEDAQHLQEAQAQAAQQQQEMALKLQEASHSKNPSPEAKSPQPPQPPQPSANGKQLTLGGLHGIGR